MKITMNLPVEPAVFFKQLQLSALADIRTHTGREPLPGSLRGFSYDGFTIQVQQTSQIEKTHRLSPCKMESPQDQLQGELDYESVHPSYLKRP
ncbi:DUF3284 domain-containing protein [Lacticaseibacillus paracasei]|uniref:DUF3284 domain-containing protein n=1 Tax=Lacticaseibacillus paracasei TaxID=1597 RepID=UPI00397F12EA